MTRTRLLAPVLPACVHRVTVYTKCKLIVSKHPTKLFNHIVHKPERCLHYLLPTARQQSVTDRLRSANKPPRVFAKTNRFKNSFVCYSLNSLQCEWCFYYLSSCVIQPSSCRMTKIDWLIVGRRPVYSGTHKSTLWYLSEHVVSLSVCPVFLSMSMRQWLIT